jgi:hypothetical protein
LRSEAERPKFGAHVARRLASQWLSHSPNTSRKPTQRRARQRAPSAGLFSSSLPEAAHRLCRSSGPADCPCDKRRAAQGALQKTAHGPPRRPNLSRMAIDDSDRYSQRYVWSGPRCCPMVQRVLLIAPTAAFGLSGLLLGRATYRAARDRDWAPAMIGGVLTGICVAGAVGLLLLLL